MADTTARALRLLELLQSAQLRTMAELSRRLGVDPRTVTDTFTPPNHPDLAGHLVDLFADACYRWQVVLRVRETRVHIHARLPASVARLEPLGGCDSDTGGDASDWYRAEIQAETLDWLPSVIAALRCEVVVERPAELRGLLAETARRLLDAAG